MSDIKSILFVCTGNSCRSVMAEGLMKKSLKEHEKGRIEVLSAGISAPESFPPTEETIEVMAKHGIDVSGYRSKKITDEMIENADLVLVMEEMHKYLLKRLNQKAAPKIFLLKEYGIKNDSYYPENLSIPDPIGRAMDYYELSFKVIKSQIDRIIHLV